MSKEIIVSGALPRPETKTSQILGPKSWDDFEKSYRWIIGTAIWLVRDEQTISAVWRADLFPKLPFTQEELNLISAAKESWLAEE